MEHFNEMHQPCNGDGVGSVIEPFETGKHASNGRYRGQEAEIQRRRGDRLIAHSDEPNLVAA